MRKIIFSFFLLISSLADAAQSISIEKRHERFSVIAEAWYANQKCSTLGNELSAEFTHNVSLINVGLALELDDPTMLLSLQKAAQAMVNSEKYSACSVEVRDFVAKAVVDSRAWLEEDRKTGMKKEIWLKVFKPTVTQSLCTTSPFRNKFSGTYQECSLTTQKLFDKCATQVDNVKIPSVLSSRQEAEKYGSIMGECITAYHFGGEYLSLFNKAQAAFAK